MSVQRLLGLDRSGPPPPESLPDQPLRPFTIPNLIGFARLALIPVFLVFALSSGDGRSAPAAVLYAVIAGSDYLDGLAARLTGQYSRLGTLLDPLTDRAGGDLRRGGGLEVRAAAALGARGARGPRAADAGAHAASPCAAGWR